MFCAHFNILSQKRQYKIPIFQWRHPRRGDDERRMYNQFRNSPKLPSNKRYDKHQGCITFEPIKTGVINCESRKATNIIALLNLVIVTVIVIDVIITSCQGGLRSSEVKNSKSWPFVIRSPLPGLPCSVIKQLPAITANIIRAANFNYR